MTEALCHSTKRRLYRYVREQRCAQSCLPLCGEPSAHPVKTGSEEAYEGIRLEHKEQSVTGSGTWVRGMMYIKEQKCDLEGRRSPNLVQSDGTRLVRWRYYWPSRKQRWRKKRLEKGVFLFLCKTDHAPAQINCTHVCVPIAFYLSCFNRGLFRPAGTGCFANCWLPICKDIVQKLNISV